jgi:hypothetical protein
MTTAQKLTDYEILTDALDLSELPIEEQEEILIDIQDLVLQGTILGALERMDDQARDDFSQLMDEDPSEEDIESFLYSRVPTIDEIVKQTIADFAGDILAVTKA